MLGVLQVEEGLRPIFQEFRSTKDHAENKSTMAGDKHEDCLGDTQFSEVDATKDKFIYQASGL